MRQWRRHQQAGTLEDDWKTQRDQYFRYISANAIYKTLKERKGDKALELIGFDDSFWGTSNLLLDFHPTTIQFHCHHHFLQRLLF